MLTILLFVVAISGFGEQTYSQTDRRDPFVSPAVWRNWHRLVPCPNRPERLTYLKRQFFAQGFSSDDVSLTVAKLTAQLCYPPMRFRKHGGWEAWEKKNLNDAALARGAAFLNDYHDTLAIAEKRSGIPPYEMAGGGWMETDFGERLKDAAVVRNVARALFSRMLLTSQRSKKIGKPAWPWWAENVALHFSQERVLNRDPFSAIGSYAGARGPFQFMPATWADFAVSAEPGRMPDPENMHDAILSAANYLNHLGWRKWRLCAWTEYNAGPEAKCPNGYAIVIAHYVKKL